jgi:hypothetical protein
MKKLKPLLEAGGFTKITENKDGSYNGFCSGRFYKNVKLENGAVTFDGQLEQKNIRQKIEIGVLL